MQVSYYNSILTICILVETTNNLGQEGPTDFVGMLLSLHNALRAEVGVPNLSWSGILATLAQQWSEHLKSLQIVEPTPQPINYGENLAGELGDFDMITLFNT